MSASKMNSLNTNQNETNALAKQYQKKTDRQHILDNPDTYIGSVENVDADMWVFDEETQKIKLKTIEYIPGLYKLFDEGIVNCRDHVIRMIQSKMIEKKFVTHIDIDINEDGTITLTNDGNGIDVAKHPEYDIWIPELKKSVEVKYDPMSNDTGNIVVEIEMFNKPSALLTTQADFWVFYDDHEMISIKPMKIVECILINKLQYREFIGTGDSASKKAFLIKKSLLFSYGNKLDG